MYSPKHTHITDLLSLTTQRASSSYLLFVDIDRPNRDDMLYIDHTYILRTINRAAEITNRAMVLCSPLSIETDCIA